MYANEMHLNAAGPGIEFGNVFEVAKSEIGI